MHLTRIAAAAAVLSLGLSACGGSSSDDKLSKSKIAEKANSICDTANTQGKKIKVPTDISDATQAAAYFDKAAPIIDKETSDLKALSPADDVKTDWNAFIDKQTTANDMFQSIRKKADAKDASGLQDLTKMESAGTAVTAAAKKVGATSCT